MSGYTNRVDYKDINKKSEKYYLCIKVEEKRVEEIRSFLESLIKLKNYGFQVLVKSNIRDEVKNFSSDSNIVITHSNNYRFNEKLFPVYKDEISDEVCEFLDLIEVINSRINNLINLRTLTRVLFLFPKRQTNEVVMCKMSKKR